MSNGLDRMDCKIHAMTNQDDVLLQFPCAPNYSPIRAAEGVVLHLLSRSLCQSPPSDDPGAIPVPVRHSTHHGVLIRTRGVGGGLDEQAESVN